MSFWRLWCYLVWIDYGRHSAHEEVAWGCPICMMVFWRVLCVAGLTVASPVGMATPVMVSQQSYTVPPLKDMSGMAMLRRLRG